MTDRIMTQKNRLFHIHNYRVSGLSQRAYCRQPLAPSRKTLSKWLRLYGTGGEPALLSGFPSRCNRDCSHNRTSLEEEAVILEYVKDNPGHGPARPDAIGTHELRTRISVGPTAVYGVLQRHGINRRRARQEWARIQLGQIVTQSEIETARAKAKTRHLEVTYPGECWGQDTFLVGRLKGIGPVYHYLAVDLRSSYAVAKLYTARNAANALDFLQNHLLAKAKNLGIHRLLQDNGTEFTAARWKDEQGHCNHVFHERARQLGIALTFIQPGHAWTNGCCERLHQTLLHEFYIPAMSRKIYHSLEELEYDLQLFLYWYNHQRTHQGFRLKGKTPAQVYFSGLSPQPGFLFKVHSSGALSCLPRPPR